MYVNYEIRLVTDVTRKGFMDVCETEPSYSLFERQTGQWPGTVDGAGVYYTCVAY